MIVAVVGALGAGNVPAVPQTSEGVTYAHKIDKKETALDWSRPAVELERAVRAFRPAPGASTLLGMEPVKVWRARVASGQGAPGTVIHSGEELVVACGNDCLAIGELQRSGGRRVTAAQFLRGHPVAPGTRFGAAPQ
jgi:methionyl-tRNA formyltransferase